MTLHGTLRDLNVVDLVQFPNGGRKTGEMIVVSAEDHARLYYRKGQLVHAVTDAVEGFEALVSLLGWEEGEFEFRQDVETETASIEVDLHLVVMQALKARDERKMEAERRAAQTKLAAEQGDTMDELLSEFLTEYLEDNGFAAYAGVLDVEGQLLADTREAADVMSGWQPLQECLSTLLDSYPRSGLARVFVEDGDGTVVLQRLDDGRALVVVAPAETSLGAASMGVNRLAEALEKRGG